MLATSDNELHRIVLDELAREPRVRAGRIAIAVEEGVVTLSGTVHNFAERWAAEDAVKRIEGVRGVADALRVELPGMHRIDDADIAKTAVELLKWFDGFPASIQIQVEEGCVTLTGSVDWPYQRDEALDAVRKIPGVRDVYNAIVVNGPPAFEESVRMGS